MEAAGIGAAWGQVVGDSGEGGQVGRLVIET
jgi:hypothetical protein